MGGIERRIHPQEKKWKKTKGWKEGRQVGLGAAIGPPKKGTKKREGLGV